MHLTVVMPIGPGHEAASYECFASIRAAHAPPRTLTVRLIEDREGRLGRSRVRNLGVAYSPEADWFLFIDADDLCHPEAFVRFEKALNEQPDLIAVFGAVCVQREEKAPAIIPENVYPLDWDGLIEHGAAGTLSMGCFIRADVARATRFDESMDAGEDFDFYLRALEGRPWTKIGEPLVIIRRDVPSATGPRGYQSLDWRAACQKVIDRWKSALPTAH
jgi:glycosyltransferase involved in cell wall biosynthesis